MVLNKSMPDTGATCLRRQQQLSYRLVAPVDAHQEQGLGDEQADAQVLVDGVAVALEAPEEAEGEEADEQADQGQEDPHPGDDVQEHVVNGVRVLRGGERERHSMVTSLEIYCLYCRVPKEMIFDSSVRKG